MCAQANKIAWENDILHAVCPQDMAEDLVPLKLEGKSKPITEEGHRSLDVPMACSNRISGISCVKLRVKVPGKMMEVWIWIWQAD